MSRLFVECREKMKLMGKCDSLGKCYEYVTLQLCIYESQSNMPNKNCLFILLPKFYFPEHEYWLEER